jgi:hypothetical protein
MDYTDMEEDTDENEDGEESKATEFSKINNDLDILLKVFTKK